MEALKDWQAIAATATARRQPLNHFFSKAKVANQQDIIHQNVERFCHRIARFAKSKEIVNLGAATSAFTRDIATDFILGKTYDNLDRSDFNAGMMTNVFGQIWRITKHVPWYGPAMRSIPVDFLMKVADDRTKAFFSYETTQDIRDLIASASSSALDDEKPPRTIVDAILESNLPPIEKSFPRVLDEVSTATGAAFETTASALRLIFYHVFSNTEILRRLRAELASVKVQWSSSNTIELKTLEQLPYLTSVLMEGLRLSPALSSRMARIAPDRELIYGEWHIPAGTPVGMITNLMHVDEELYPDPMRFDPSRWMDLGVRKNMEEVYAPFSRGTRMCVGMHLAWADMYLLLPALVQNFNFEFKDVTAKDLEYESDQFSIGTRGYGVLSGFVTSHIG